MRWRRRSTRAATRSDGTTTSPACAGATSTTRSATGSSSSRTSDPRHHGEDAGAHTANLRAVSRLLLLVFASAVLAFAFASSAGLVVLWRLRRRNRLHPKWPTMAPISWLVHPGRPARLHRRLRHAVATAHYRSPGRGRHKIP